MARLGIILGLVLILAALLGAAPSQESAPLSEETKVCLDCHKEVTPGIVADWKQSRHYRTSFGVALKEEPLKRRVSAAKVEERLLNVAVGCAECHTLNPESHKDSFDHEGAKVHPVVTPKDCSTCHTEEASQYSENIMSHAYGNLRNNPVYWSLAGSINGTPSFKDLKLTLKEADEKTEADSCLHCHGTRLEVKSFQARATDFGEMSFPVISGWPNQGVGRVNPDASLGACTSCHPRHSFSIKIARSPATCSECHKGPDVLAYKAYEVSKHGNIYLSMKEGWEFESVPWEAGKDFTAPTCATCHVSLLVNDAGKVVAKRTHKMADRIYVRLLGLIYAHPQPKSPDTTLIKNSQGLPLPTDFSGNPASAYLIDEKEQEARKTALESVCLSCHTQGWVGEHFARLESAVKNTNETVLASTKLMLQGWQTGVASQKDGLFNEPLEKLWVKTWLFDANAIRLSSAMSGADHAVFADGRWNIQKNLAEMQDAVKAKKKPLAKPKKGR